MEMTGPLRKEIEVFTDIHSIVTSATTPMTPIQEETMETNQGGNNENGQGSPKCLFKIIHQGFPGNNGQLADSDKKEICKEA